jgi:hypothetical protein
MINPASLQQQILNLLKASPWLSGVVGDDIREYNWMGEDYDYPSVRMTITRVSPEALTSNCEFYDSGFEVSYRCQGPSSMCALDGITACVEALKGQRPSADDFVSEGAIVLDSTPQAIPEAPEVWLARAFFSLRMKEIT